LLLALNLSRRSPSMKKGSLLLFGLGCLSLGIVIGGYLFSETQRRSFLTLHDCDHCYSRRDLYGLLLSAGIQKTPGLIPAVVFETDKSIVVLNPLESRFTDYLIFPKRDIRHIGDIAAEDLPYLYDAFLAARRLIAEKKLNRFRMWTNGPDFQDVRYLHFHVAEQAPPDSPEPIKP
jgi:hypothetical protein